MDKFLITLVDEQSIELDVLELESEETEDQTDELLDDNVEELLRKKRRRLISPVLRTEPRNGNEEERISWQKKFSDACDRFTEFRLALNNRQLYIDEINIFVKK